MKGNYIYLIRPKRPGFGAGMTADEERVMDEHFEYLKRLRDEGRVRLAGPCLDAAFGIVILQVADEAEARKIMLNDPSVKAGIMEPELHAFKTSLSRPDPD